MKACPVCKGTGANPFGMPGSSCQCCFGAGRISEVKHMALGSIGLKLKKRLEEIRRESNVNR